MEWDSRKKRAHLLIDEDKGRQKKNSIPIKKHR